MPGILLYTRIKTRWFYALAPSKASEGIFSLVFPLFLLNVLQAKVGTVGVLTALISLTAVPGSMFWGTLSDRRQTRRSLLALSGIGSTICLIGMGLAWSLPQMALLCLVYGVFSIALAPISSVLIMETIPPQQWESAFGSFNKIGGWGWVGGLAIGAFLLPLLGRWFSAGQSLRVVFLGLAATTLFSTCWAWRTIPQPIYRVRRQQFVEVTHRLPALTIIERALYLPRRLLFVLQPAHLRHLWQPVQSPLWRYLLATAVMFVSFTMALTPFPLFLQTTLELDTSLIFALVMVRALASVPCYEWAGRWVHHVGPKRVQSLSLAGRCLMFLVFWSLEWLSHPGITVSLLVSMNMLAGITWSLIAVSGPVLLGRLAGPGHKGKAMGMYNATQGGAQIIGAILGGYLAQWAGYYGLFAAAAMLLLPAIGLLASLRLAPEPSTPLMQRADTQTHKQSNQVSIERSL